MVQAHGVPSVGKCFLKEVSRTAVSCLPTRCWPVTLVTLAAVSPLLLVHKYVLYPH